MGSIPEREKENNHEQILQRLGLTSTCCARCGHEHSKHIRLAICTHRHPAPCQLRECLCPQFVPLQQASYLLRQMQELFSVLTLQEEHNANLLRRI